MEVDNVITQAVPSVYPVGYAVAVTDSSLQERWYVSSASGHARRPVSQGHVTSVSACDCRHPHDEVAESVTVDMNSLYGLVSEDTDVGSCA